LRLNARRGDTFIQLYPTRKIVLSAMLLTALGAPALGRLLSGHRLLGTEYKQVRNEQLVDSDHLQFGNLNRQHCRYISANCGR